MLKNIAKNTFIHILLLFIVAVFTFLPALEMLFYLDEWGNLYDFTHSEYKFSVFTAHIMYLLYRLFGADATGWFGVGIVVFALSVVTFYFFVQLLLKNKMLALIAALLYATTPVGTNTVTMIWTFVAEGGYPLNIALLVLLYLLLRYFRQRRIFYFFVVVIGFLVFLELEPRRVFLFLPILILFDYLINFKKIIPNAGFMTRLLPLFIGFVAYNKYDVSLSKIISTGKIILNESASAYDWQTKLHLGIDSLTHIEPLVTLTNILLAGPWVLLSERLTGYVDLADVRQLYLLVVVVLSVAIALVVVAFRVKREFGLVSLFSLGWIYINIWGIYVFSSPGISETTHRTLSLAAPAYALFVTVSGYTLFLFLKKNKNKLSKKLNSIFLFALVFILAVNFLATRYNFEKFNDFRSRAARAFFKDLKNFYPTLPPNSILYIQTPANPQIKYRLSRIYGGNYGAGGTIAVFYPELTKEEINVTREYQDVEKFVEGDPTKIDHVFAFYFDEKGLSDKTVNTRSDLQTGKIK